MAFFADLFELDFEGDLQLVLRKTKTGFSVITLVNNANCTHKNKRGIIPFTVRGTPAELDDQFIDHLKTPVEVSSQLQTNLIEFSRQAEEARKKASTSTSPAKKIEPTKEPEPPKDPKEVAFEKAMADAQKLIEEKEYRKAYVKLPDPVEYPQHAEEIKEKRKWLTDQFSREPSLFNLPTLPLSQPAPVDQHLPFN